MVSTVPLYPVDWPGYCPVCARDVTFRQQGPWLRDELVCTSCYSIPRLRALVHVLTMVRPDWQRSVLWEMAPSGPSSAKLAAECPRYVGSQYWSDVRPGDQRGGVRCEDVENPSFADGSVDVVVSSDVFEHVFDVDRAMQQIARVLSPSGVHVWTTPQYGTLEVSKERVRRTADGIEHLVPAEYHGDPVNDKGVLVTFDWGRDLPQRVQRASGLTTTVYRIEAAHLGILGEFIEVFVSAKDPRAADLAMRAAGGQTSVPYTPSVAVRANRALRARARPLKAHYRRLRGA